MREVDGEKLLVEGENCFAGGEKLLCVTKIGVAYNTGKMGAVSQTAQRKSC